MNRHERRAAKARSVPANDVMTKSLSVRSLNRIVEQACAIVLLLKELGFNGSEVSVGHRIVLNAQPLGWWATVTVSRGGIEEVIAIASLQGDRACDDFTKAWVDFCQRPLPSSEAIRILQASTMREEDFIRTLKAAGFSGVAWDGQG